MQEYKLDLKGNALDSFNEALVKYSEGEAGDFRAYKFAILHLSHFLELILKIYISSIDANLIFKRCYKAVNKRSRKDNINLLAAFEVLKNEGFDFELMIKTTPAPFTITLDQALEFAKCETCQITGTPFVDNDFCDDIEWLKGLRNDIEHFEFSLTPKDVRLCIGRLVRGAAEFLDVLSLFDLESEVGKENYHVFEALADEYEHLLREAKLDVKQSESEAFQGIRLKHYVFVDWRIYECPECQNSTMIKSEYSHTGFRCAFCGNEESDDIEVSCDCCGDLVSSDDISIWDTEDGNFENRCYFCSGRYYADKND